MRLRYSKIFLKLLVLFVALSSTLMLASLSRVAPVGAAQCPPPIDGGIHPAGNIHVNVFLPAGSESSLPLPIDLFTVEQPTPGPDGTITNHTIDTLVATDDTCPPAPNATGSHITVVATFIAISDTGDFKACYKGVCSSIVSRPSSRTNDTLSLTLSPGDLSGANKEVDAVLRIDIPLTNGSVTYGDPPYTIELKGPNGTTPTAQTSKKTYPNGSIAKTIDLVATFGDVAPGDNYTVCVQGTTKCSDKFNKVAGRKQTAVIRAGEVGSLPDPGSTGTDATTCAIGGIGWIICPVVNFMAGLADHAYNYLADNFLSVKIEMFDTTNPTYSAWSIMRSFANVAFVIAFLIIIFSQLTGFGIANYGIKKLLPRIIIAAILVNLSYFICQFAVDLSNILGKSLSDLFMNMPVPAGNQSTGAWSQASGWSDVAVIILAGVAGVVFWSALTALIPVLIAVVVALIMVLFILVARQAIIILLVVIAPLAFVAYLLPNTEQWFTKWRKLLTSMLLLYPIVALVYGVSTFASKILGGVMDTGPLATRLLGEVVAASVAVLPLFLIPSLLKKSLDGVGNIGKTLNNLGSRVGKAGGQKYTNSGYNQHRVAKQKDMKVRTMTGNYRGRGGNWNPRNLRSKLNSRVNRNSLANFATGGYAASRELAGQTQDRKDIAEAMEMFGHDDDLALAWARDGGAHGTAYNEIDNTGKRKLTDSQRAQYDRMRTAGLDRKASSHIAAAQMISTGGKGDHGATEVIEALKNAREHGASETTVGGETEQAKAAFRKAGRGDALAALKTAGGIPTTAAEGWSEVAPSTVHRDALKDTAGKLEYQNYLSLKPDNTRAALAGYDQMEGRARTVATDTILVAADKHAENAYLAAEAVKKGSGVRVDITTIQQAKDYFGVR